VTVDELMARLMEVAEWGTDEVRLRLQRRQAYGQTESFDLVRDADEGIIYITEV
jgi:hypothetical protein